MDMLRRIYLLVILVFLFIVGISKYFSQETKKDVLYIKAYAAYAVEEMNLYKIPASITLAQGLLETAQLLHLWQITAPAFLYLHSAQRLAATNPSLSKGYPGEIDPRAN